MLEREIIERRAIEQKLRDHQQELELAIQAGRLGLWWWDVKTGRVHSTETQAILHGRRPDQTETSAEVSVEHIHPDDRAIVQEAMRRAAERSRLSPPSQSLTG